MRALVRDAERASHLGSVTPVVAQAIDGAALRGVMDGVDLVISALGITRQRDGLSYWDVDYEANANLLAEALDAGVRQFAYVHVINAEHMLDVPLVAAKQAFAERLRAAPIKSTIIAPTGFFSDLENFLTMASTGRAWLFRSGALRFNPIHGADLAEAAAAVIWDERAYAPIGGPDVVSHRDVAEIAFAVLGRPVRITMPPDWIRRVALRVLPWVTPAHVHGPALFLLTALGMDTGFRRSRW